MIAHGLANHKYIKVIMWNRPMVKFFTEFIVTTIGMVAEIKMTALFNGKVVKFL